jgi:hypothetical protein
MLQRADTIAREEEHITNRQLASCLLIREGCIIYSIRDLGYSNVCFKWIPRVHTVGQETERKPFLLTYLHVWIWEETYSRLLTADKTGYIIFAPKNGNP